MVLEQIIGLSILFLLMVVQVIIPPIPAEIIVIGAAKLYGVLSTTIVAGSGLFIGSIIVYYFGKFIQKKFEFFFNKNKVKIITQKLKEYDTWILWLRILPYNPSDIISYAAGIIHVEERKFFTITFITSFLRCLILSLLGSYITNLQSIFYIIGLLVFSAILAQVVLFNKK